MSPPGVFVGLFVYAATLGGEDCGDYLDGAGAVVDSLAYLTGAGAVGQEAAEEELDVGVLEAGVVVFGVDEAGDFGDS